MKLIDFFKTRKKDNDFQENELEKLLIKGGQNLEYRDKFYEKILTSELIFMTEKSTNENGKNPILSLKNGEIPIFTSEKKIFEGKKLKDIYYLKENGKELLKTIKENTIIINPFSKYSFTIPSETIENIVNGIKFNSKNHEINSNGEKIKFDLRMIDKTPSELINDLTKYFKKEPRIIRAYIAEVKHETDNNFNILIALDSTENISENIINKVIPIAEKYCKNDTVIDFIQINEKDNLSKYFKDKIKPFYQKNNIG